MGEWKVGKLFVSNVKMIKDEGFPLAKMALWGGAIAGGLCLGIETLDALSTWAPPAGALLDLRKLDFEGVAIYAGMGAAMPWTGVIGTAIGMTLASLPLKKNDLATWRDARAPAEKPSPARTRPLDRG